MPGGVIDGQAVSAGVTDPAFIFKNADDITTFNCQLASPLSGDGGTITRPQREFNSLWGFIGGLKNQVLPYLPVWLSNNFGTTSDTIKERIEAIDATAGFRGDSIALASGISTKVVTFSTPFASVNYAVMAQIANLSDSSPQFLQVIVTGKTTSGFTVTFNAETDSNNYILDYRITPYA